MSILTKSKLFPMLPGDVRGYVTEYHRLSSSSRLKNRKQAGEFILERCFVSVFSGTELPSIQEAIEGRTDNPGGGSRISTGQGIASIWLNDLPEAVPCLFGIFVKRKPTLVTRRHWAALLAMEGEGFQEARECSRISPAAFSLADCIERDGPATSRSRSAWLVGAVDSAGAVDEKAVYRWFGWARSMTGALMNEALLLEECFRVDGPNPVIISSALAEIWPKA